METDVYAENNIKGNHMNSKIGASFIVSTLLITALILFGFKQLGECTATRQDLASVIAQLNQEVDKLRTKQPEAFSALHAKIDSLQAALSQLNISGSVLMAGSTMTAKKGTSFNFNVSVLPGTSQASALQGTIIVPQGWTINSVTTGPAASAAGKSVSFNATSGIFIIAGLNQNLIQAGVVAVINFKIPATANPGLVPVSIISPSASDPNGNGISISNISGTVAVGN